MPDIEEKIELENSNCNKSFEESIYFKGLEWFQVEHITSAPAKMASPALRIILALRKSSKASMAILQIGSIVKLTETQIIGIAQAMPILFSFTNNGTKISLRAELPDPWEIDEKTLQKLDRDLKKQRKKLETEQRRLVSDEYDTPANKARRQFITAGLTQEDARKTAYFLIRTYPENIVLECIEKALIKKPDDFKSYVIGFIKKTIKPTISSPRYTPSLRSIIRPDATRKIEFSGWEDRMVNGIRHKLYRLPNGHLKREVPVDKEIVPSFIENPGFQVLN